MSHTQGKLAANADRIESEIDDCDAHERMVYEATIAFIESVREAAPTSPAQEDEPVHQSSWDKVYWADISKTEFAARQGVIHTRTLYTHPDQSRLRKDAERYRFIKSHSICELNDFGVDLELYVPTESLDDQLDAAIDAAMKEEK